MKVMSTHFDLEPSNNDMNLMPLNLLAPVEYVCGDKKGAADIKVIDIPINARRLVFILDHPDKMSHDPSSWIAWEVLLPSYSPFTESRDTHINQEESVTKGKPKKDFFRALCEPEIGAFRLLVHAIDNEPKPEHIVKKEDLDKAIRGHIITTVDVILAHREQGGKPAQRA